MGRGIWGYNAGVIYKERIVEAVEALCLEAAYNLPGDVTAAIGRAIEAEVSPLGRGILARYLENAEIARRDRVPICQDTGLAVYFVEKGRDCRIGGGSLFDAVKEGTARGYVRGYLRKSVVVDPLYERVNSGDNSPPVIHFEEVEGADLKITLAPKGAGSENMSRLAMLKPLEGEAGVIDFVVRCVSESGANPCPPTVVGVGIGGNFERAAFLAKKALVRPLGAAHPEGAYAVLEQKILDAVNACGVGPQGLGGTVSAFAVHVEKEACHIASLPVAVNLNCHAARHASVVLHDGGKDDVGQDDKALLSGGPGR